jgi:dihydrolipoamide dehydrogenase (EC 1.8.1.4)
VSVGGQQGDGEEYRHRHRFVGHAAAGVEVDNDKQVVVDSTGALELARCPAYGRHRRRVIGLELGSVWRRLGAKVTCVEFVDQILPGFDGEVRKEANKIFKKQGIEFRLGAKVTKVDVKGEKATLTVEPAKGGDAETIEADCVLVSIGRKPNTDGLGSTRSADAEPARADRNRS